MGVHLDKDCTLSRMKLLYDVTYGYQ